MRASRGKGTKRLPAPLRAFARLLVPAELRDDVEGDLIERYHARLDRSGRLVAFLVIVGELVRIRPWALRAVVRSNRSNRASDGFFRTVSTDVKLALRGFRRRTGNAILIVGTLLLAVGGTTLLFSVVNGVLLRPLPYPDSHELIRVWQTNDAWLDSPRAQLRAFAVHFPASFPIFRFWEDENRTLEAAGAFSGTRVRFQETDQATLLSAHRVTSGVFQALDVQPLLGRWMLPEEDKIGGDPVAVLSHATWRERFGADSSVVGRTITLDRTQHTIVGVMPAGFEFPGPGQALWMSFPDETRSEGLDSQFLQVVGRLSEGTDLAAARRDIGRLQRQMAEQHPEEQKGRQATLELLLDSVVGEVRTTLLFLFASVGLVLVVACANIANLLFGLGLGKQRELAVRSALGAGRRSLLRTSFVESGLLTAIGGSAGLTLAWLSLPLVLDWVPGDVPRLADVTLDWRVLAFTILVTLAATFVIGLLPALHAMRTDPARDLRVSTGAVGGPRAARIRAGLVVSEVALAFLLLAGAGLLANSYARLVNVDTGFESSGLVRMSLLPDPVVFPDREAHHQLALELRERLRSVPGVMGVSATNQVPLSGSTSSTNFWIQGSNGESEDVNVLINVALDGYFEVMGIELVEGRGFTARDTWEAPSVAVVSETLARLSWPGESAVGRRVRDDEDDPWITVIGVARDVHHQGLATEIAPMLYVPALQSERTAGNWVLKTRGDGGPVLAAAREAVKQTSRDVLVSRTAVLSEEISARVSLPRFRTLLIGALAALAALLALIGIYGVMVFTVTERMREFGVRLALGARPGDLIRTVLGRGVALAALGMAIGVLGVLTAGRVLESFLFGVQPTDPVTLAVASAAIVVVGVAASLVPARRAASVDPMSTLKAD